MNCLVNTMAKKTTTTITKKKKKLLVKKKPIKKASKPRVRKVVEPKVSITEVVTKLNKKFERKTKRKTKTKSDEKEKSGTVGSRLINALQEAIDWHKEHNGR